MQQGKCESKMICEIAIIALPSHFCLHIFFLLKFSTTSWKLWIHLHYADISMMTTELGKSFKNNACIAPCLCKLAFSPISALYHHIFALSHLCHCAVISFHFCLCSLTQTFYYRTCNRR